MARFTVRKAIHFTTEQAKALDEIAKQPEYTYNDEASFAAVVRDAVALFLSQNSTLVDDTNKHAA
mgnify:CR=1 FL=1